MAAVKLSVKVFTVVLAKKLEGMVTIPVAPVAEGLKVTPPRCASKKPVVFDRAKVVFAMEKVIPDAKTTLGLEALTVKLALEVPVEYMLAFIFKVPAVKVMLPPQ